MVKRTLALYYALTEIKQGLRQKIKIHSCFYLSLWGEFLAEVQVPRGPWWAMWDLDGPCEPLLPTGPKKPGASTASFYALSASFWLDPWIHERPLSQVQFIPTPPRGTTRMCPTGFWRSWNQTEANQRRISRSYLFWACYLARPASALANTQRQTEEWESFLVEERGRFRRALIGGRCPGEAGGGLPRQEVSCVIS